MIKNLQRFFHTDTRLGKVGFVVFVYIVFWFLTYGVWIFSIIPDFSEYNMAVSNWISPIYFFILIPALSFWLAFYCKKILRIDFFPILVFNILFIFLSLYYFFNFLILNIQPNFF